MTTIYTMGYERHTPDSFLAVLQANGIEHVIDVRDLPNSRKRGFAKTKLSELLAGAGITYESVRALGNPKDNRVLWRADLAAGQRAFEEILAGRGAELDAVAVTAAQKRTTLLCLEADPELCHRTMLGRHLANRGLKVIELS